MQGVYFHVQLSTEKYYSNKDSYKLELSEADPKYFCNVFKDIAFRIKPSHIRTIQVIMNS